MVADYPELSRQERLVCDRHTKHVFLNGVRSLEETVFKQNPLDVLITFHEARRLRLTSSYRLASVRRLLTAVPFAVGDIDDRWDDGSLMREMRSITTIAFFFFDGISSATLDASFTAAATHSYCFFFRSK